MGLKKTFTKRQGILTFVCITLLLFVYSQYHALVTKSDTSHSFFTRRKSQTASGREGSHWRNKITERNVTNSSDSEYGLNLTTRKEISNPQTLSVNRCPSPSKLAKQPDGSINKTRYNDLMKRSRLPDVVGIGAKKCGTHALQFYLTLHPQMCVTNVEVHYYDRHDQFTITWYRSNLGFPQNNQLLFEKTPRYFVTKSAPRNMKKDLSKDVKFILLVRDPVVRLLSDFRFTTIAHTKRSWRKKQTQESETTRLLSEILSEDMSKVNSSSPLVYTSDYASHFKEWLQYFDRSKFLIIDNDEMKEDAAGTLQAVERYLGLDSMFHRGMFEADGISIKISVRNGTMKDKGKMSTDDKVLPHPVINETVYKMLQDYFRPRNEEFERLSGMAFSWTRI